MNPDLLTNNVHVSQLNRCIAHQLTAKLWGLHRRPAWALTKLEDNDNFIAPWSPVA